MQPVTILSTNIIPYHKKFQKPFTIAGQLIDERQGLILTLSTEGVNAQGEIAPLEGVSPETYKKAQHDLLAIESQLKNLDIPLDLQEILNFLRQFKLLVESCPSVRFGVESAILNLLCQLQKKSLAEFLGASFKDLSSAILLQGSAEEIVQDARNFVSQGRKVFKLKIGSRNIPLDVKKVNALRRVLPSDARIRLDVNKAWSLNEAILFAQLIGLDRIEFIEEPLADIANLNEFYDKTHMPVALDETLSVMRCGLSTPGRCLPGLDRHEAVVAYVLKPTVLGGIIVSLDWINQAKGLEKKVIISSCFESAVGLKVLKDLALVAGEVPGLGTEQRFI